MARGRNAPGRTIDFKEWELASGSDHAISTDTTTIVGTGMMFDSSQTILRLRGNIWAAFDETVQAGDTIRLVVGIGVVSQDAFAAGAGSLPEPNEDPQYPWMWWGEMALESFAAAPISAFGVSAQHLVIDSKAMRRVRATQTLVTVIQSRLASGAPVTNVKMGSLRVLIGK